MIALLQRVSRAEVRVHQEVIAEIDKGVLVFVAVEKSDTEKIIVRMLDRVMGYRIFADEHGKMNLDVQSVEGGVMIVPQFTLAANTQKGLRPSFASAAPPEQGKNQFLRFVELAQQRYSRVECGKFGADMKVDLVNDGPVTFWLQSNW